MHLQSLPGILEGTCSGERRQTTGCPNRLGKCWKAELLSLSTIRNSGFLVYGYRSPGCKLKLREDRLQVVQTGWGSAGRQNYCHCQLSGTVASVCTDTGHRDVN